MSGRGVVVAISISRSVLSTTGKFHCGPAPKCTHRVRAGTRVADHCLDVLHDRIDTRPTLNHAVRRDTPQVDPVFAALAESEHGMEKARCSPVAHNQIHSRRRQRRRDECQVEYGLQSALELKHRNIADDTPARTTVRVTGHLRPLLVALRDSRGVVLTASGSVPEAWVVDVPNYTEHVKAQNWTAVVLDFLVVVAGVFVGVQVNEWWLSRLDARKERAYLLELKQDFGQVIRELESDTKVYEGIALAMVALLEESRREKPQMPLAELNRNCNRLLYMVGTSIVSDTYANLIGSGDLSLIRSQELRNALASFYARTDIIRLVSNTHELQLVNTFQPYIVRNLDYLAVFALERAREVDKLLDRELEQPRS